MPQGRNTRSKAQEEIAKKAAYEEAVNAAKRYAQASWKEIYEKCPATHTLNSQFHRITKSVEAFNAKLEKEIKGDMREAYRTEIREVLNKKILPQALKEAAARDAREDAQSYWKEACIKVSKKSPDLIKRAILQKGRENVLKEVIQNADQALEAHFPSTWTSRYRKAYEAKIYKILTEEIGPQWQEEYGQLFPSSTLPVVYINTNSTAAGVGPLSTETLDDSTRSLEEGSTVISEGSGAENSTLSMIEKVPSPLAVLPVEAIATDALELSAISPVDSTLVDCFTKNELAEMAARTASNIRSDLAKTGVNVTSVSVTCSNNASAAVTPESIGVSTVLTGRTPSVDEAQFDDSHSQETATPSSHVTLSILGGMVAGFTGSSVREEVGIAMIAMASFIGSMIQKIVQALSYPFRALNSLLFATRTQPAASPAAEQQQEVARILPPIKLSSWLREC